MTVTQTNKLICMELSEILLWLNKPERILTDTFHIDKLSVIVCCDIISDIQVVEICIKGR